MNSKSITYILARTICGGTPHYPTVMNHCNIVLGTPLLLQPESLFRASCEGSGIKLCRLRVLALSMACLLIAGSVWLEYMRFRGPRSHLCYILYLAYIIYFLYNISIIHYNIINIGRLRIILRSAIAQTGPSTS